jgi:hypothetical protein
MAHSTATVIGPKKVGYMKLLADGRIKPLRAWPAITIMANALT